MKEPKLKPSLQQLGFYDWITNGSGSCVLVAVAGAGKTTALIQGVNLMKGKIFLGAFNKNIAVEIAEKIGLKMGVEVSTMHAAGMRAWKKVAKFPKVDNNKVRDIFRAEVQRINPADGIFEGPVTQLVSLAKQAGLGVCLDEHDVQNWMNLVDHFGVELFEAKEDMSAQIIKIAKHVFKVSNGECMNVIDFDDMIFAPLYFKVSFDHYDWVLVDEAQDTNAVRREMSLRMIKPITGRLVAVGDPHQAIYGFTGADARALDMIATEVNATRLPLTTTFRCPKAVVKYAKTWVNHIEAADTAPDGIVRSSVVEKLFEEVAVGDAILCRFNAPLVKNVYQLIAKGIPARIEGREIGAGLKQLANRWKVKSIDQLLDKLGKFLEAEVEKYTKKENLKAIEAVTDRVDCLRVIIDRVLAKGTITVPPTKAVIDEIDAIFGITSDGKVSDKPVVLLSSIHKAKGREWHKVIWLTTGPSPYAKKDWEKEQEDNLCYVAATRTKHELVLIPVEIKK